MAQQHLTQHMRKLRDIPRLVHSMSSRFTLPSLNLSDNSSGRDAGACVKWTVLGVKRCLADDFQHMGIEMEWPNLCAFVASVYMAVSLVFALGFYYLLRSGGHHFSGELSGQMTEFEECFWTSVANVVTIGYGTLVPASRAAYTLATLEHFAGILMSALLLGIVVTKASIPTSKIVFSDVMLMTKRNGVPVLIFRVANTRGNFLLSPDIRVSFFKPVTTKEGEEVWIGSPLEFTQPPVMAPCFNLVHRIGEDSPLFGMSYDELLQSGGNIGASIGATDDESLQTLYARKMWRVQEDVRYNQRFVDVLKGGKGVGPRILDMACFNKYVSNRGADNVVDRMPSLKEDPSQGSDGKSKEL
ncbi:unnamed protein product [Ostreobium quekettii]|uniref:Potassium channel domain-containing protein n=1 Tax=Ostreobium quekettii TaxID=121088 RepID=A0A8S1J5P7_9CHLO|nr:unnamed protein product [Ostreobium quekettii]|eukprot:evm.model.scf_195.2 EVM.evm.TU.scf_195.2   scf_195:12889-14501(-)